MEYIYNNIRVELIIQIQINKYEKFPPILNAIGKQGSSFCIAR